MNPDDPIDLIDLAVRQAKNVTVVTRTGLRISGQPLHIGPKSVWMVVANTDVFVPLDEIAAADAAVATPEGAEA